MQHCVHHGGVIDNAGLIRGTAMSMDFDRTALNAQPLTHATALPAAFYTSDQIYRSERDHVFANSWQFVAQASRIEGIGDHVVSEIAGLPVIVMRTAVDEVRAYHNVCRHRAGPLATCDGKGAKALRCRYHGWTYGLDGVLRSAPEMASAPDFDPSTIRLPELQVAHWQGMIFVAAGNAPPLAEVVAGIDQRMHGRSLADYRFHQRVSYEVACNWKVYVDNYLEGYHVPHIHPTLNALLDYRSYVTEVHDWYSYQYSPLESAGDLYGDGDALYYFIYPNTMLNVLPGRLQTNRVLPLGPDRCRVEFDYFYPPDDSDAARERRERDHAFSHVVQDEDVEICEAVQRGLASGSYQPGRLNPLRENAVHHFQEILRKVYRESGITQT